MQLAERMLSEYGKSFFYYLFFLLWDIKCFFLGEFWRNVDRAQTNFSFDAQGGRSVRRGEFVTRYFVRRYFKFPVPFSLPILCQVK